MSDPAKRPGRLAIAAFIISIVLNILTYFIGYKWAESRIIMSLTSSLWLVTLFSFVGWWHAVLVRREANEDSERERVKKQYDHDDLFDDSTDSLRLAADAHKNFDRFFVTTFTIIIGAALAVYSVFRLRIFADIKPATDHDALQAAGLSFFLLIFCLLSGSYFNGLSREKGCRYLRPIAGWLYFSAFGYILAFISMVLLAFEFGNSDAWMANLLLGLQVFFGLELILNFIIEFYRPRSANEEERPLYESRVLALFTEPGGIAKNVAHSLDYQFGFKVSETWFYGFIEKAVVPFVVGLGLVLYMLNCFVELGPHEMGFRETLGKANRDNVLGPGLHLKLPAPFGNIKRIEAGKVRSLVVGVEEGAPEAGEGGDPEEMVDTTGGRVLVWDKHHYKDETPFVVPAR